MPHNPETKTNFGGSTQFQKLAADLQKAQGILDTLKVDSGGQVIEPTPTRALDRGSSTTTVAPTQRTAPAPVAPAPVVDQGFAPVTTPFNPQQLSGVTKIFDDFKFKVDEINNDPFISRQEKNQQSSAATEAFSSEFAKSFGTTEDFNAALQDKNVANLFRQFEGLGGDVNNVAAKVEQGLIPPQAAGQSLTDYIGALDSRSKVKAFTALIPQQKIAQDEIAFEQSIPQQYRDLYFGTEEQIGFLERQSNQAEAEIKLLERQAKLDEKNAKAQVDFQMDKMAQEHKIAQNTIEKNRLSAKNYMTGALAKLGALKTTGAAPVALGTLEQKYQQQSQVLQSDYDFANRGLRINLSEEVDNIGIQRDVDILKVKGDLSKSEEDVLKEIFKLQNTADSKTFKVLGRYADDFRREEVRYEKEAKAAADKYARDFAEAASDIDFANLSFSKFIAGGGSTGQSFTPEGITGQIPPFIQTLLDSGKISPNLEAVITGEDTGTPTQTVRKEMTQLGITNDMLAGLRPDTFGKISNEQKTKGVNAIQNDTDLTSEERTEAIEKFRTDRAYQAFVLDNL